MKKSKRDIINGYPEFSEPLLSDTEDVLKIAEEFMVYITGKINI